ncbi:MAG: SDR family oxidoreductase [Candidatus Omnitrophota bacterium]
MMNGKVVLITGASGGIGAETARLMGRHGANVVLNYRDNADKADRIAAEIRKCKKGSAIAVKADVSKMADMEKMMNGILKDFKRIDIIVNNASSPAKNIPFADIRWNDLQRHLDTSLRGPFNTIKCALPHMMKQKSGKIINVLTAYTLGAPPAMLSGYISGKYALLGFSRSLASELGAHGVTVNCLSPGMTETDFIKDLPAKLKEIAALQTPLKRLARPIDIARVILFLSSDASDHITGANIPVCGGSVM